MHIKKKKMVPSFPWCSQKKRNLWGFLFLVSRLHPWAEKKLSGNFSLTQGHKLKSTGAPSLFLACFLPGSSLPGNLWRVACTPKGWSGNRLWKFYCCFICSWRPAFKVFSKSYLSVAMHWRHGHMEKRIWDVAQPWRYSLPDHRYFHPGNRWWLFGEISLAFKNWAPSLVPGGHDKNRILGRWENRTLIFSHTVCVNFFCILNKRKFHTNSCHIFLLRHTLLLPVVFFEISVYVRRGILSQGKCCCYCPKEISNL